MPKTLEELTAELAEANKRAETAETALKTAQADVDKWKSLSRKNEERATENAEKAKKFDDLDKTEVERERARAEKAETALKEREDADAKAKADADAAEAAKKVRDEVATAKKIAPGLLRGSTKDELEAHADELIAAGIKPATAPPATGQGDTGTPVGGDEKTAEEVANEALGR